MELIVEDAGEGLDGEARRRAFEPFFTTRSPAHLGLRLTIALVIATGCGGSLDIADRPEGGATVTLWLAVAGRAATSQPAGSVAGTAAAPDLAPRALAPGRASILVLEDDEVVRAMLVEALGRAGHDVHVAADGDAGRARLERERFDVVVADLALPQHSGLIIARAVKRLSPRTPVILITGRVSLLDPERLRDQGVDLMLVKPFRPEHAVSVVSEALRLDASG